MRDADPSRRAPRVGEAPGVAADVSLLSRGLQRMDDAIAWAATRLNPVLGLNLHDNAIASLPPAR